MHSHLIFQGKTARTSSIAKEKATFLPYFCAKFLLVEHYQLLHNLVDLLVGHRLFGVLEFEAQSVGNLARLKVLAFVNIEQLDILQEFLLALVSNILDGCKLNVLVNEQCKVAANRRELADFLVTNLVIFDCVWISKSAIIFLFFGLSFPFNSL